ncbi:MAG TPA: PAS domain-containing protein [Tepidisphaeraceae bacterium]|jgi:PAS domain S-box-containing protein|nr:PAS domain-containing protein [Tepidisphaeraceae bacterium]
MPDSSRTAIELPAMPTSEMAARVHAFDWATTPLGPMNHWPQSLRTAVSICLNSRFPMFVWWGPDLVNIYNDAYAPILGKRHPAALGRPARQTWHEIWSTVGPQAEAVMLRGESTWNERVRLDMERQGFLEETYFTWSYSPIHDESNRIGGLFCACTEETQRVMVERERDRMAEQRRQADERARTILESITDAFFSLDGDWRFTYVNPRGEHLLGRAPGDLIGKNVWDEYPQLIGTVFEQVYRHAGVQRVTGSVTSFYPDHDRWYEVHAYPAAPDGIAVYFRDATERKEIEARDRFLLSLDDALRREVDPDRLTAHAARLLRQHLQADRCAYAEVVGDDDDFYVTGDDGAPGVSSIVGRYELAAFGKEFVRSSRAGQPYVVADAMTDARTADVRDAYRAGGITAVISIPLLKGGRFAGGMAVHQRTPRDWRAAEVELVQLVADRCWESIERARVERALRASEQRLRAVVEATPECVKIVAPDGGLAYMNPAGLSMIEADSIESVQGACTYDLVVQEHRRQWVQSHARVCAGERLTWEFEIVGLAGTRRWMETHAVPLTLSDGRTGQLAVTRDITTRKRAESEREQLLASERAARVESERAGRMKDEFLATLSHELRTPLNAIVGWAGILARGKRDDRDLRDGLDTILRNARAQTQIIEDLLDMSRIISGKVRLDVQRVDLDPIVRAAVEAVRPAAEAKGVRLQVVLDPLAGPVSGDAGRLQQVFWNLLSNALKFTPRDGRVQVVLERVNSHLEVSVSDTGEGISPEFLPFVFDRFRQADASTTRLHGGLGLGLAIVRQLVELHGGSVRVNSPGIGQGSTFTVALPLTVVHPEPASDPLERRHPTADNTAADSNANHMEACESITGVHVLVVDDEPDARALVKRLLEDCGATVATAGSASAALERLQEESFDVLLSDIGMPGEDGYDLIRKVRARSSDLNGRVASIALTAYARGEDRVKAIVAGFDMHITKPIEPVELIAVVSRFAARNR